MGKKDFKFDSRKLFDALLKRAEGFFYSEEILEYGEVDVKEKLRKNKDDNVVCEFIDSQESSDPEQKDLRNSVSKKQQFQKPDIYSEREMGQQMNLEGRPKENNFDESSKNLVLLKKKVTTHYVPPDLTAVKMLFENFGQEVRTSDDLIESMSDEELLKLKSELIAELEE